MLSLGMYTVIMCLVIHILCTKIVDIKLSAHDTFLEKPSIAEILLKVVLNTITLILSMLSNPIDLLQNYIKVAL
jgi:uncharacterized membrane protein YwzB